MNLETLTPRQARDNFYALLDVAIKDKDTFADIGQAATDWMNTVRAEARQETLTAYRNDISIPFETTYPVDKKRRA